MKYLIIIGFLILNSGINLNAQTASDSLKSKIKMVKEVLYKPENGQLKKRENLFDSNISSYKIYDKNEKVIEYGKYKKDGTIYEKTFYTRNEEGVAQKTIKKNSLDELKSYWTSHYDSNNNLIEVKTYNSQNKLTNIQSNKYDEDGNNIEMLLKKPESENGWKYVYKYNFDNKKIEQLRYKPDGSLKDKRTYSYDEDGNENLQVKFNPDGSFTKFVSEYDEMDNMIVQNWFNEQDEQKHQTSFEYVYDKNGNWTSKRRSSNGELGMVWERLIEYYE
ncbi:hypothetical protein EJ994_00095 [Maribacter sp. MJ134]|uniref:hypothetical protein n=1 Tax=Maribacter sp. MJ134 TaxID=2496865 RepID=UPI000F8192E3|nr:hypothetical protein [Maribacter sp. MJ134]AZQ57282.1 hypothetical protein EJ994_00095 [Maribacter sp. MJ134]